MSSAATPNAPANSTDTAISTPQWLTTGDALAEGVKLTPVMKQVVGFKQQHPDCLLFFRLGDFYELFFEDALVAAPLLDMVLTSRNKKDPRPIPMCGFPYHAMASYVQRSLDAGQRVAVVEQLEDPKKAKGPVKRGLTRVITPGVVLETEALDGRRSNNLAAIVGGKGKLALAVADASTGAFHIADVPHLAHLSVQLVRIEPREIIAARNLDAILDSVPAARGVMRTHRSLDRDAQRRAGARLTDAAVALMRSYLAEVRPDVVGLLDEPSPLPDAGHMRLGRNAVQHLELLETVRQGRREGSLLHAVDRTMTVAGARWLRSLLLAPLADRRAIEASHGAVQALLDNPGDRARARQVLTGLGDLARIVGRASAKMSSPKELATARDTLDQLPGLRKLLGRDAFAGPELRQIREGLGGGKESRALLHEMLAEDPQANVSDGGVIRAGHCAQLDELRALCDDADGWLEEFQEKLRAKTGNPKLRVHFHRVSGCVIEVTRSWSERMPAHFRRVSTLKNAERFTTPELAQFERRMLSAEEDRIARETELFDALMQAIADDAAQLRAIAACLARLDVHAGFAELAEERGCCRPQMTDAMTLELTASRHPVVEAMLPRGAFVPNDVQLRGDGNRILLLTGPNMAGKSTLMRQVALCSLLAQAGGFVPAEAAVLPVLDAVMTRIGASDDISEGASTFMVEMRETAEILQHASPRTLVLLDEVGRGTSTHDGLSIAWAVIEHLHDTVGALCLFATHYHELTALADRLQHLDNAHVTVREWGEEMVFVYRLAPGPTNRSHGIAVARLAGIGTGTIERATEVLRELELRARDAAKPRQLGLFDLPPAPAVPTPSPAAVPPPPDADPRATAILDKLSALDPDDLSPRQAHAALTALIDELNAN